MRSTLQEWAKILEEKGDEGLVSEGSDAFLVTDPSSVFNIPDGPSATMRIDRALFLASTRGEFHPTTPAFAVRQRADSVYSFVSVGRTENCDVCLPDDSVSKLHALMRKKDGAWMVQDADSANGTLLNEQKVPPRADGTGLPLQPGDVLSFGAIQLHFHDIASLKKLIDETLAAGDG
jgi:hypothetical protein